ncbi:MAG TPA: nuclear transport factor 2 family protein [Pseudonocardia sp.]
MESRTELAHLVARYCQGVDRKDLEQFSSLWHDDAEYLIGTGRGDFHGLAEIRRFPQVAAKVWRETYHWTTNHVVEFTDDNRADGTSDCLAICTHHSGQVSFISASYLDRYERRDTNWKFARREVKRWFVSAPVDIELLPPH